ncbi:wax ester/triacylglycerol synthase domain-containing protein [Aeromicrobium sp.]|uniref:wax ester/triacylglycerol synthase domain-containing protein n=1 Tax=Aeromicrobium sp. TaxID=1871063 RepID=UPI003D6A7125
MTGSGTPTPLRMEDARILALESGPIRGHTLKVLTVEATDSELPVAELRAQMAERLQNQRPWTERLVPTPNLPSKLAWQEDTEFDIGRHVHVWPTEGPVDSGALARCISDIMMAPLDRSRPLWRIDVIPRLGDGRSALVWKVHHCMADGLTIMRAGPRFLWTEPGRTASEPEPRRRSAPGGPAQVTAGARLARALGYRGLMTREFSRVWGLSPLAGEVGPDRIAASAQCRLDELRALGKAVAPAVTINDVLLAVVAGALRRWLEARGAPTKSMKVQVPVSMQPKGGADDSAGNRDSFLFVRLPVAESDPVARVRAVARATGLRKNRHDARAIYALRESLSLAPSWVRHNLQHVVEGPHEYSLNISNVPGPRGPIQVLDRHVEALYSFAEVAPSHGLRIAAVSLEGWLFIGLMADRRLVPDLDRLADGIPAEVAELRTRLGAG